MNARREKMFSPQRRGVGVALAALLAGACATASGLEVCGSPFNATPVIQPVLADTSFSVSDAAVDCFMWQTFIYLNWPALVGQRGQPDPNATFGAAGATVWETFKDYDEVYLPNGKQPNGWNDSALYVQRLKARGVKRPAPTLKLLTHTSKVFRRASATESAELQEIDQVGGGTLYDQASKPVYYEMLMNQTSFDYVYQYALYDAQQQYQFAQKTGIVLPPGSMEIKAAWKVLTPAELAATPMRFLTVQAVLPGSTKAVTMGLVGLHVFEMPSSAFNQGFWATFQQIDNAPPTTGATQAAYSFNNPQCAASQCPPNQKSTTPHPTQVVQMFGASQAAQGVNSYVQQLIVQQTPSAPQQFYALIDVQWPTSPQPFGQPGQQNNLAPITNFTSNTTTNISPVLETFLQRQNTSCLGCHTHASVSTNGIVDPAGYESSLSFLFGHAQSSTSNAKSRAVAPH